MREKQVTYRAPGGSRYLLFKDMIEQPHLLIAGATGSGKSVVINAMVYTMLQEGPWSRQFILIDPKRVELSPFRDVPHTLRYASEQTEIIQALNYALALTDERYKQMQKARIRKYAGSHVYVIIDELADLMTTQKAKVQPLLQRLAQIGRAANVHIVAATQCPLAIVIPTSIKVNFDARLGLRTRCAQDSRNILGVKGCEDLPRYGKGLYMTPEKTSACEIPMYKDDDIEAMVNYWTSDRCIVKLQRVV